MKMYNITPEIKKAEIIIQRMLETAFKDGESHAKQQEAERVFEELREYIYKYCTESGCDYWQFEVIDGVYCCSLTKEEYTQCPALKKDVRK